MFFQGHIGVRYQTHHLNPRHMGSLLWPTSSFFLICMVWRHCHLLFKCNHMPECFVGSRPSAWPLPLPAACWDNRDWNTKKLEALNGSKVFLWSILAKNVESPLGLLKISAQRLHSRAQQRHQTNLEQRKLLCLRVKRETMLYREIQSSRKSLNLFVKYIYDGRR